MVQPPARKGINFAVDYLSVGMDPFSLKKKEDARNSEAVEWVVIGIHTRPNQTKITRTHTISSKCLRGVWTNEHTHTDTHTHTRQQQQ
jgi:D-aminopeptidase